jgi:hypothetical protein
VLDALRRTHDCNVVLSDDGLQHRGLRRDVELAVFDARGAGNGHCLPAGPLREPLRGALLLDALVLNGAATVAPIVHSRVFRFTIEPTEVIELADGRTRPIAEFVAALRGETVDAVAGIGAPARFFDTLRTIGVPAREHALPDHSAIDAGWLAGLTGPRIVMTEKDAVKCSGFDPALRARCGHIGSMGPKPTGAGRSEGSTTSARGSSMFGRGWSVAPPSAGTSTAPRPMGLGEKPAPPNARSHERGISRKGVGSEGAAP